MELLLIRNVLFHWGFALVLIVTGSRSLSAATLISTNSSWRFLKGTNEVSASIGAWREVSFADSTWTQGAAPFHYGEGLTGGTALTDMQNRYSSVFLRRSFDIADLSQVQELRLRAICDDGFIAWINGVEVARYNVPVGERAYNTFAASSVTEPISFLAYPLPKPPNLVAGNNVLAVQVFNATLNSTDLRWDGELTSVAPDVTPPRIASVEPPPGTLEKLTSFSVTFTEPVSGVRAEDLFLGARAAISVTNSGVRYTFTFAQPDPGPLEIRWDADTLITDLAASPNRFDPVGAGTWQYLVVDRTAPTLAEITPRPGLTVRALAQVEIRFSEPVGGVDASDLLVNGVAAMSVSGELAGPYRFQFTMPSTGQVRFSWVANHGIRDQASPPNSFTQEEWLVTLDPSFSAPPVRVNEFLASNVAASGLKDEDGELQDWIEIYNAGTSAVNLDGWSLTDDRNDPGRWVFPAVSLGSGQYLLLFASGKDRKPTAPGARLHTNFKLNPAGEYLALLNQESPRVVVSEFGVSYPEQRNDYSYGYDSSGQLRHFRAPTPGAVNGSSSIEGVVPPAHVNIGRGWFDAPFTLFISSELPGVTHRFTRDGSEPTETNGEVYSSPLHIAKTTTLRVASFKSNMLPSTISTHTYLFADDVLRQPNNPVGFPATWGTHTTGFAATGNIVPSDYEMDPEVVTNSLYRGIIKDALLALPTVSIVLRTDEMFGAANGIYTHPLTRGPAWERPCSMEFIPNDGSSGFQINAGVQVQGNAAREPQKQPKHPLRVTFKGDYGPTRLNYQMFPDSPVTSFDTLILRADFNYMWLHWDPNQRVYGQRTRDAWMKDSMRAMGGLASHNRYVHLFINGLYWGIYDPSERPDGSFGAAYLGGEKEDYDVVNEGAVVDGSMTVYNAMLSLTNLANASAYAQMQTYLDLTQFIDYMLLHFYGGHQDWGQNKNWYTVRPKDGRRGFLYVPWDGEMVLASLTHNRVSNTDVPSGLHTKLVANAEYRLTFADRVRKHLFNGGALTPEAVSTRWMKRAREVELPIVAESARWGDYRRDVHSYQNPPYVLFTRDDQWRAEQNRLLTQYFPQRTATLLAQLRTAGLYPDVGATDFNRYGGRVERGFPLTMTAPEGTIYFTTDGSDPRVPISGTVSSSAQPYVAPVTLSGTIRVKARVLRQGTWSALTEADFQVAELRIPLRITEIMYNPPGGDAFEFLEIQNVGSAVIDVTEFSFTGIDFVFPTRTILSSGQTVVLASSLSPSSFTARYPGVPVGGYFKGSLSNGGERIELRDRQGRTITAVEYRDDGAWPSSADGLGFSLEVINPDGDPNDPANWLASSALNGSPGKHPSSPILGAVRLSEILAKPADNAPVGEDLDWIELANVSDSPVSLGGWTLTDHGTNQFVFPTDTVIPPAGYLLVWCDARTNSAGLHAPFRLDAEGETVGLYDVTHRRVDALTFGQQVAEFTVSRIGADNAWQLSVPTPKAANVPAELASPTALKINEWLANPRPGDDDWLELYNSDLSRPAVLQGLALGADNALFQMHSLSFVPPHGFIQLLADESGGARHVGFKIPASGGSIVLLDPVGIEIDRVNYTAQVEGVSQGRLPDGAASITSFPGAASPGQSNGALANSSVLLNEILVTAGKVGWVELFNPQAAPIDLSGFQISFLADGGDAWAFPSGSRIAPSEYLVIQFDPAKAPSITAGAPLQTGRPLKSDGGGVHLWNQASQIVDSMEYGFLILGQSIGRIEGAWRLLLVATPGGINAPAAPLGPASALRINEWLATPATGDDWFELFNTDTRPVSLTGLFLTDDPTLAGQRKFQVGPLSFIAPGGWVVVETDANPNKGPDHANFVLDHLGEALRLYATDGSLIDAIDFGLQRTGISEGRLIDGGPEIGSLSTGPTREASNTSVPSSLDTDGDGLPDAWEVAHGTNPARFDADADPDGDGLSNMQEYQAGTHPNDPSSGLRVTRVTVGLNSVALEFSAISNRTYSVSYKRTLSDASWSKLIAVAAQPTNHAQVVVDSAPLEEARFYRLTTPAEP